MASNEREELQNVLTAIIYGNDWRTGDFVNDIKPDVEAFMLLIDKYCEERERVAKHEAVEHYKKHLKHLSPLQRQLNGLQTKENK